MEECFPRRRTVSTLGDGCDGDAGDVGFRPAVEVGIASGCGADPKQVTVAEVIGEVGEPPANNHHVGRGKGQGEFVGRRILVIR